MARSWVQFTATGLWDATIITAKLKLWEWHSWSCVDREWEAYRSPAVSASLRWTNKPNPYEKVGSSLATTGYNSSCADGWVEVEIGGALQYAASNHTNTATVMLRSKSETDNLGWKRFNSAEASSNDPYVSITYNSLPGVPTGLSATPCYSACGAAGVVSALRPTLKATLADANAGQALQAEFAVRRAADQVVVASSGLVSGSPAWSSGSLASWTLGSDLVNTTGYEWQVRAKDVAGYGSWSAWTGFSVDTTAPGVPFVSGTPYVNDGQPYGGAGTPGVFTFTPASGTTDLAAWVYKLDTDPAYTTVATTGAIQRTITPPDGHRTLTVKAKDSAGNESAPNLYVFEVGAASIAQPLAGAVVAKRTKLQVFTPVAGYTKAYFQYRRGAGGAVVDLPSANLTTATGAPVIATPTSPVTLASLGGYAVWSVADTLGWVGGVVEVRAQMFTDTTGPVFTTDWVRFTVDPDGDNAAAAQVGPGSVNLLTGDYTLTSTDADELGLSVGRAASSREPQAGYLAMGEQLSANQQQIDTGTTGFDDGVTDCVTFARVTSKGQGESGDSLQVTPTSGATAATPPTPTSRM